MVGFADQWECLAGGLEESTDAVERLLLGSRSFGIGGLGFGGGSFGECHGAVSVGHRTEAPGEGASW